jgi:hypothetical protein
MKTIRNNYLLPHTKRGSFDVTEVGLNVTKTMTDRLRLGVQLFGGGFVSTGAYNAKLDWFYFDYRWRDWLGIRAGRVKLPFGLYNEINDVDSARLPILLPQATYPATSRNFLLAQTGAELYGYLGSPQLGALEYRLYGGTIVIDPITSNPAQTLRNIDFPYVVGGRLMWETPLEGLRAGGSVQVLRLDTDLQNARGVATLRVPAWLSMGSLEYSAHDWLIAAELGRWRSKVDSSNPMAFPEQPWTNSDRFYGMVAYRVAPLLQVGAYYSRYYKAINPNLPPEQQLRSNRENHQHDVAGTLRFDINDHWLVKLEGHFMKGTAALDATINDRPIANLSSRWAVFMVKTTAYF